MTFKKIPPIKQGTRFGRLVTTGEQKRKRFNNGKTRYMQKCICDCGKISYVTRHDLYSGNTKSCGCLNIERIKELSYIHGDSKTKFYHIWKGIKRRCNNINNPAYKNYGGRGIINMWENYKSFKQDMYESYLKHIKEYGEINTTIDRIDTNGNYCKENCRRATIKEQSNNRRNNREVIYKGKKFKSLAGFCRELGLSYQLICSRLRRGYDIEKAISQKKQIHILKK